MSTQISEERYWEAKRIITYEVAVNHRLVVHLKGAEPYVLDKLAADGFDMSMGSGQVRITDRVPEGSYAEQVYYLFHVGLGGAAAVRTLVRKTLENKVCVLSADTIANLSNQDREELDQHGIRFGHVDCGFAPEPLNIAYFATPAEDGDDNSRMSADAMTYRYRVAKWLVTCAALRNSSTYLPGANFHVIRRLIADGFSVDLESRLVRISEDAQAGSYAAGLKKMGRLSITSERSNIYRMATLVEKLAMIPPRVMQELTVSDMEYLENRGIEFDRIHWIGSEVMTIARFVPADAPTATRNVSGADS